MRIWVRVAGDQLVTFDGTPLPRIKPDTIGHLVLPATSIVDDAERGALEAESVVLLLPDGTTVLVGLSPEMMERDDRDKLQASSDLKIPAEYCFAEVRLLEALKLRLRGGKEPWLEPCKCFIQVLNQEAGSLNHAFTLLSTKFETKRISHSGNAFTRVYCYSHHRKVWHPLNEVRGHIELSM